MIKYIDINHTASYRFNKHDNGVFDVKLYEAGSVRHSVMFNEGNVAAFASHLIEKAKQTTCHGLKDVSEKAFTKSVKDIIFS